jgi:beta-N-acetylhexosaminidase
MGVTMAATRRMRTFALGTLLGAFPGPRPPAWALRLVEEGLGGIALFGYNIADLDQVATLTAALRGARPDVIIATDEEGGDVTRLCYAQGSPYPGNAALGAVDDVDLTGRVYRAIGAELAAVGITLDMAPAVDVNSADDNPAIGTRSFGKDPRLVAAHAAAAVVGLQAAGVAACAKHFPGHGATEDDSHLGLPLVDAPVDVLWQRELPPFEAAIKAGVRSVMTAHIRVPSLTGDRPATFSPEVLSGLLRTELGFTGAVVSDALEMRGASAAIGIPEAAVRALIAGNDLLCIGGEFAKSPRAEELTEAVVAAIVEAVHTGRLAEEQLEEAAARTALLGHPTEIGSGPADPARTDLGVAAARRAVRVEGALPAGLATGLVLQLEPSATMAVGEVPWGLAPQLPGVIQLRMTDEGLSMSTVDRPFATVMSSTVDSGAGLAAGSPGGVVSTILARSAERPIVVVSRDTHRHAWARELVEALSRCHPGVVLVEMGWPAAWRPAGVQAYVASYGASRANAGAVAEILLAA